MRFILLGLLLISTLVSASYKSDYYYAFSDYYEHAYNLYYKAVYEVEPIRFTKEYKINTQKISNLLIYDIENDQQKYLFEQDQALEIIGLVLEEAYEEKEKQIRFYHNNVSIKNNQNIDARALADKLLVVTVKNNSYALWIASKQGNDLKKLIEFDKASEWHLDAYNRQIRVITQTDETVTIKNFSW